MLSDVYSEYTLQSKASVPDGLGGEKESYSDSATKIMGCMKHIAFLEIAVAEQGKGKSTYQFCYDFGGGVILKKNDVLKSENGSLYRITSNSDDSFLPAMATLNIRFCDAERLV